MAGMITNPSATPPAGVPDSVWRYWLATSTPGQFAAKWGGTSWAAFPSNASSPDDVAAIAALGLLPAPTIINGGLSLLSRAQRADTTAPGYSRLPASSMVFLFGSIAAAAVLAWYLVKRFRRAG